MVSFVTSAQAQYNNGYVPLDYASEGNDVKAIKVLLEQGADPNRSAYVYVHTSNNSQGSRMLRALGGSGEVYEFKPTPFENAVKYALTKSGSTEIIALMIEHGADVNHTRRDNSETALEYVINAVPPGKNHVNPYKSEKVRFKIAEFLIAHGADVSNGSLIMSIARDYDGKTREESNVKLMELLLKNGAYVNPKNNNGNTALCMAKEYGFKKIAKLLEKYGGTE